MMGVAQTFPKVFSVSFSALKRWDPNSFHGIQWHWSPSVMAPIGSVLLPRKEKVDRSNNAFSDLMPITIHFDGSAEPRKVNEEKEYSMELFWARPGDIVASKIDLKNGAVAIIPDEWDKAVVTNHFAVYEPNLERLNPKYFHLLIQASFFTKHLWRNKVGAEGRKEVKLYYFESLEIPIPPLTVQQKIVTFWENELDHQRQLLSKKNEIKDKCRSFLLNSLGIKKHVLKKIEKIFCLNWANAERWSYEYNKRVLSGLAKVRTGQYQTATLSEICKGQSGSTPSKMNPSFWLNGEMPWVSPKDMKAREISNAIDHITLKAVEDRQAPIVPKGSILFVVRSGILQKTVPVAVTRERVSINQDIRAFIPRNENVLPDFLLSYFETKQEELLHLVKWSTTVQSINKEELESFPVPLPPMHIQKKIISSVNEFEAEINNCEAEYQRSILSSNSAVEQMILGLRSVEDI